MTNIFDEYLTETNQILVQKTKMGNTESYLGVVSLKWIANQIKFASELPLFTQKIDSKTNNIIRDSATIEYIQQRPLDWSRQAILSQYLLTRPTHKFPPLLVVINPAWVDNPTSPEWENERAVNSSCDFQSLDSENRLGLLNITENCQIYALDGQHRLMGIQGLITLLETGQLPRYNRNKKPSKEMLILKNFPNLSPETLANLPEEKMGVEFISAVNSGETREEAKRRIRSIFVHVNQMSVNLSKGQLAILNEDQGFSILSRQVAVNHPLFSGRISWDTATVTTQSKMLTTLQGLEEMCQLFLQPKFPLWKPKDKGLIPIRPENQELDEGLLHLNQFFDELASLPSYQRLNQGVETVRLRRFHHDRGGGEGNLLFRPVGQVALAAAVGVLIYKKGFNLGEIFEKLRKFDDNGGFTGMEFPKSPWYGVLYDASRQRIVVSGRKLATKLMIYLLGGLEDQLEVAYLRESVAKARTFENRCVSFQGEFVKPKEVGLPELIN
jgi:DGQHR domain-containing protein